MITRRSLAIVLAVAFTLLLVLSSAVQPWMLPGIGDIGTHTWSGSVIGHRAAFDLLTRLNVKAERNISSPGQLFTGKKRIVLLDPSLARLETEQAHLEQMRQWIEDGGELVLVTMGLSGNFYRPIKGAPAEDDAPAVEDDTAAKTGKDEAKDGSSTDDEKDADDSASNGKKTQKKSGTNSPHDEGPVLPWERPSEKRSAQELEKALGKFRLVERLGFRDLHIEPSFDDDFYMDNLDLDPAMFVRHSQLMRRKPEVNAKIDAKGSLAWVGNGVESVRLPKGKTPHFVGKDVARASGSISVVHSALPVPIALEYELGKGKVILASEPALFNNFGLSAADDVVLAYRIMAGDGTRPVVLDEYYRLGHPAQGNTLSLMLAQPYWIAFTGLLFTIALWVWRQLVRLGPPLPNPPSDRRSILEYVDTMANLFWRGGKHVFALNVLCDGLLDELRHEVHLPPGSGRDQILRSVEQRDPAIAAKLRALMGEIAALGAGDTRLSSAVLRQFMERLNACKLPKPGQRNKTKLRSSTIAR